jgi:outer membrane protein OmpA-like peptidoglycan-associated protein
MIVSLPDILFDTDQATLKNDAKIVIAKLAGILLILPELNLRVEGHTDSTGSADYNQDLSERRAVSVRDFLAQQGIGGQRMVAVGYGLSRPVADNATREGRAKNRRVEIVIAEGEVAAN